MPELIDVVSAVRLLDVSRSTFWRFRVRRKIRALPGRKFALDDILRGLDEERGLSGREAKTDNFGGGL